jgi:hypothetical protein
MHASNEGDEGPKKLMKFHLLSKRPVFLRLDLIPIPFTAALIHHYFGESIFDAEHILAVTCLMLAIGSHILLFLLNFWSVNANVFFCYSKLRND